MNNFVGKRQNAIGTGELFESDSIVQFPADASSTSCANKGPALSALPWALAELTRPRPFIDTGRLVVNPLFGRTFPGKVA